MKKLVLNSLIVYFSLLVGCSSKKDYTCICNTPNDKSTSNVFTQLTEQEIINQCDDFYKGNPTATTTCISTPK